MTITLLQALDTFNTAVVSPIYYALFTSFTILASAIMFKVGILCPGRRHFMVRPSAIILASVLLSFRTILVKARAVSHQSYVVSSLFYLEQQYCTVQESQILQSLQVMPDALQCGGLNDVSHKYVNKGIQLLSESIVLLCLA